MAAGPSLSGLCCVNFKASLDSLEVMEGVMRHFYLRAMTEQRMGDDADWNSVDALMLKVLAAAEKVARYRHAQRARCGSPAISMRGQRM
jgi:hypothetical protein